MKTRPPSRSRPSISISDTDSTNSSHPRAEPMSAVSAFLKARPSSFSTKSKLTLSAENSPTKPMTKSPVRESSSKNESVEFVNEEKTPTSNKSQSPKQEALFYQLPVKKPIATTTTTTTGGGSRYTNESKYRNMFVKPTSTSNTSTSVSNIPYLNTPGDNNGVQCNHKYFATAIQRGAGAFLVAPIDSIKKYGPNDPIVDGHKSTVLDFDFNPFRHSLLASASDDCTVKLWEIPEEGLTATLNTPSAVLRGHGHKVYGVKFHPSVSTVACSVSADGSSRVWDIETAQQVSKVERVFDAAYHDLVWNSVGSGYMVSSKDQKVYLVDARTSQVSSKIEHIFDGSRSIKLASVGGDSPFVITVGSTKSSMRQCKVWDVRNPTAELIKIDVDTGSGVLMPFYDNDTNILYVSGKGDGHLRCYELSQNRCELKLVGENKSNIPTKGLAMLPRRILDASSCEVSRFLKLSNENAADYSVKSLSFSVPRDVPVFKSEMIPDAASDIAPHTFTEWLNGSDAMPARVSLKPVVEPLANRSKGLAHSSFFHQPSRMSTSASMNVVASSSLE